MKHLYYFLTIALCVVVISSCGTKEKNLTLQGVWNEEVSSVYDTINHSETRTFVLDCENIFSFVRTMYYRSGDSSLVDSVGKIKMLSYNEYVAGKYTVQEDKIYFDGRYYINSEHVIPADSINTNYNYGPYLDTITYVIDGKYLMFNLDVLENQKVIRFVQEESYDCNW
jgi:hypothetical protein